MELTVLFFLTSGLFLGWSLGANDAANVFGTAVGSRMVRFSTAALVCGVFILLGAMISGAGAAHTLGSLGSVNALAGAFMAALSAGLTVYAMTRWGLPVSTSQAIVGSIIGWNLFSDSFTDIGTLTRIVATWVACPILAGVVAVVIFKLTKSLLQAAKFHLLRLDAYTRIALLFAGAFGAYSLGANNIGNVMGVFISVSPFTGFEVADLVTISSVQQLFLLGAIAIAIGVFTYSKKVMFTVGKDLMPLSPVSAWVVVIAHSIVLFVFASEGLEHLLASSGLPTIPLVPVSSSQAVVGAVLGLGLMRGGREIQWSLLGNISIGWVTTPLISGILCFVGLFFLQNVFNQQVYREVHYMLGEAELQELPRLGITIDRLERLKGEEFASSVAFLESLRESGQLTREQEKQVLHRAELGHLVITPEKFRALDIEWLSADQRSALYNLLGQSYSHKWLLAKDLEEQTPAWRPRPDLAVNKRYNKELGRQIDYVFRNFDTNGIR